MEYVIGFDGGGTKTEVLVVDSEGNELLTLLGGPSNSKSVTVRQALLTITGLLDECYGYGTLKPQDCRGICLGLAGVDNQSEREAVAQHIKKYYEEKAVSAPYVYVTNDAEIALVAGLGQNHGIIAIAGTGAIVFGMAKSGHSFRAGGWGHLLGDKGSGYEIGLQALQTIMLSYDGVLPHTLLTEFVLEKLGLHSPLELRNYIYQPHIQKQHIADIAELCIVAAEQGDQAASAVIKQAATDLAGLTAALRNKDDSLRLASIAISGSIFTHSQLFREVYSEQLNELSGPASIVISQRRSVYGASILAAPFRVRSFYTRSAT